MNATGDKVGGIEASLAGHPVFQYFSRPHATEAAIDAFSRISHFDSVGFYVHSGSNLPLHQLAAIRLLSLRRWLDQADL
jgi:hypothetical protein